MVIEQSPEEEERWRKRKRQEKIENRTCCVVMLAILVAWVTFLIYAGIWAWNHPRQAVIAALLIVIAGCIMYLVHHHFLRDRKSPR